MNDTTTTTTYFYMSRNSKQIQVDFTDDDHLTLFGLLAGSPKDLRSCNKQIKRLMNKLKIEGASNDIFALDRDNTTGLITKWHCTRH